MALFLSEHLNRVDKKGRVSVPAPFRTVLGDAANAGVFAFPSFKVGRRALEVWPPQRLEQLQDSLDQSTAQFSDEQQSLATLVFAEGRQLHFDDTGRVMLPQTLMQVADLNDEALFVGQGRTFQIWEPKRYEAFKTELRAKAETGRLTLPPFPVRGGNP